MSSQVRSEISIGYQPEVPKARRKITRRNALRAVSSVVIHVVLIGLALLCLTPFAWLICAAFKAQGDMFKYAFLPWHDLSSLTLDNLKALFITKPGQPTAIHFGRWLFNSLFLAST